MADLKISQLAALAGANLATADELAIVDSSASETKKITVTDLVGNATTLIADATIPGAKILFGAGDIAGASIADGGISTAKVADDAITAAKLGNESTVDLVTTLPGAGAFTGQIALDTDDNKIYIWDGSAWQSVKGAGSVNVVNGNTTGILNITVTTVGDTVTITPSFDNTTAAAQFLGGPTGGTGVVGYRAIVGTDLPTPTTSVKGAVIVNGEGLRMDGDTIEVDNDVTANSSTYQAVQFDSKGLITAGRDITAADLPAATSGAVGAIKPGTGLTMGAAGALNHTNALTGATATKVTFDAQGHISSSSALIAADIPDLDTAKITTGTFATDRIADNAITGAKIGDKATATIASTTPNGGEFIGQYHFNSLNRELFLWDGNVWQPIGISVGEIVLSGTFDASAGGGTGLVDSVTSEGTAVGLVVGQALPAAAETNKNYYLVVSQPGTISSGNAPNVALAPPDFLLSNGGAWTKIDVSDTVVAQQASNVSFTPAGDLSANNVQTALEELDTEKIGAASPTFTGDVTISTGGTLILEGATANAFETTLTVTDPTADRTITFPNVTGSVVTTGDTGTVTSLMITDGAIVDADINANAEIAVSKLVDGTARQLLQTDAAGTGVEWTSNVDIPGTLDVTGAATLDSTLVVTSNANAASFIPTGSSVPTNGVYLPAANTLAFATNTSERIRIGASGQIGLAGANYGTSGQVLTSGGSGAVPTWTTPAAGSPDSISEGNTSAEVIDTGTDGRFVVTTEGSEAMRIDSSGRLLVGASSSPTAGSGVIARSVIQGNTSNSAGAGYLSLQRGQAAASIGTNETLGQINFSDSSGFDYAIIKGQADGAGGSNDYPGKLIFGTTSDGASTTTDRMVIDSSGKTTIQGVTVGRGGSAVSTNTAFGTDALNANTSGGINTANGNYALTENTTGSRNTAIGYNALRSCTTANNNTAVGTSALYAATTGAQQGNTAVGDQSARYLTTGARNVAVGYFALFSSTTSSNNTALGGSALYSNTTGASNVATGYQSLYSNTTGYQNVAVGYKALYANTTGYNNIAIGENSLRSNTTGRENISVGRWSMYYNTTGNNNVATGFKSLHSNTTGAWNTANGYDTLRFNTTGSDNVATGSGALYRNTTGSSNVANGVNALSNNTTGGNNVATGLSALNSNTTGIENTSVGRMSMYNNTTASGNTALGTNSLYSNTTGVSNVAVGLSALYSNTTGSNNTANGYQSLFSNTTGANNVAFGANALYSNTTAGTNTAVGKNAAYSNTTGIQITALGKDALYNNTTGNLNVATGYQSLYSNTTGTENVAHGPYALYKTTTGPHNVGIGSHALFYSTTGSYNTATGNYALLNNTTGSQNTATGYEALANNTTGSSNTALGYKALEDNTSGYNNLAVGHHALKTNNTGHANTAVGQGALYACTGIGKGNTGIGHGALASLTTGRANTEIGGVNVNGSWTPAFTVTTHDNRFVAGSSLVTNAYVKVSWTVTSDERDKMNFAPVPHGLDFVNQLKPTAYQFKVDRDTEEPHGDVRYGFKAQDILALEGDNPVIIDTEDADNLRYKGESLVPVLVNAVQELTAMVNELKAEVAALKSA